MFTLLNRSIDAKTASTYIDMVAVIFLIFEWCKNSVITRHRKQAKIILITILIGSITDLLLPELNILIIPSIGIILAIIPIIGIWHSIKKYKLMDLNSTNFILDVMKIMNEGLIIAVKILDIFKKPFILNNHELFIITSIGGAIYPVDDEDVDTLIKNADIAMHKVKEGGKNQWEKAITLTLKYFTIYSNLCAITHRLKYGIIF